MARGPGSRVAGRIPDHRIDEVRAATDIVELVSSHVRLKRTGKNYKGLCPFHEEKTPSFIVNPDRQTYKCFGCGEGGNAFLFVQAMDKLTFPEAVRMLADRAGIRIETSETSRHDERRREEGFRALRFAAKFFAGQLHTPAGRDALGYLERRGMTRESIDAFGVGYALPEWDALLRAARAESISTDALSYAGLVLPGRKDGSFYDRFRNRVTFAIRDLQDRVIGFGARTLGDDQPKYLNSPDSPLFNKSAILYGLPEARATVKESRQIAVCEGYTDVILAYQAGFHGIVATLGTALTPQHARLIRRFADRVVLVYDADDAGAKASARGVETVLEADLDVRVATLPEGVDPCDLIVREGPEAFRRALDEAADFFEYLVAQAREEVQGASLHDRARLGERLLGTVARVRSPVKQGVLVRSLSEELGIPEEPLLAQLASGTRRAGSAASRPHAGAAGRGGHVSAARSKHGDPQGGSSKPSGSRHFSANVGSANDGSADRQRPPHPKVPQDGLETDPANEQDPFLPSNAVFSGTGADGAGPQPGGARAERARGPERPRSAGSRSGFVRGPLEQAERDLLEAMCARREIAERVRERFVDGLPFRVPVYKTIAVELLDRFGRDPGADVEELLGATTDADIARLLTQFLGRERADEDYARLEAGAYRYFAKHRQRDDLRELAEQRREAAERGDDDGVDALLRATFDRIREADAEVRRDAQAEPR